MLDDLKISQCIACEVDYGNVECKQCPLYECEGDETLIE